ncbi:MAG: hypothetical protein ACOVMM_12710 [Chitinophagaceae bacterium]
MIVYIGYLASVCLAFALIIKNTIKARWFNVAGNVFFITYGILIPAFPIIIANTGLLVINIYQLYKLYIKKEQFKLVVITHENNLGKFFLEHYKEDIETFFPNFKWQENFNTISFMVLRNMELANVFVASVNELGHATVEINYTIPKFRDYKVGKFIFEENKNFLKQMGVNEIVYNTPIAKSHEEFLLIMGFEIKQVNQKEIYSKML